MRHAILVVSTLICATTAATTPADDSKPVAGALWLGERVIPLVHIVAYETKVDDEALIAVIASDRKISLEAIRTALKEGKGSDENLSLNQPYLKLVFQKSGEAVQCVGSANGTFFTTGSQSSQFAIHDGKAQGHAELEVQGEGNLTRSFEIKFDVPIGLNAPPQATVKRTGPVKPSVSGTFKGNGKDAKLAYVTARRGEPFADKPSIKLVFTEKDHTKDSRADFKAAFGDYGSALIISLHEDGSIFGCEVSHTALENKTFSSIGSIRCESFDVTDGQLTGHLKTEGEVETFDQTWEVDIKFTAPFGDTKPAAAQSTTATKPRVSPKTPPPKTEPATPAAAQFNIHDFPFPKDAANIEYKTLVKQLEFKSPTTSVKALASQLIKQLATQGWTGDGADLVNAQSTILNRTRGEGSLTIFVKPEGKGSVVRVMSEGLDWSEKAP